MSEIKNYRVVRQDEIINKDDLKCVGAFFKAIPRNDIGKVSGGVDYLTVRIITKSWCRKELERQLKRRQ